MRKDRTVISRLTGMLDMSAQPLPGLPIVELCADERVLIENHNGVIGYGREEICVAVNYGRIKVKGSKLKICFMSKYQLVIVGQIGTIQIERSQK